MAPAQCSFFEHRKTAHITAWKSREKIKRALGRIFKKASDLFEKS
jgi:hypothetical protein